MSTRPTPITDDLTEYKKARKFLGEEFDAFFKLEGDILGKKQICVCDMRSVQQGPCYNYYQPRMFLKIVVKKAQKVVVNLDYELLQDPSEQLHVEEKGRRRVCLPEVESIVRHEIDYKLIGNKRTRNTFFLNLTAIMHRLLKKKKAVAHLPENIETEFD